MRSLEPAVIDDPNKQPDIILITFDKFEAIAQKLKDELLRGTIVPSSEDEISRLMYSEASA